MLEAIETSFPGVFEFELTDGGMHIVAFLKRGIEDKALASLWTEHDLCVKPLSNWYAQTQKRYGLVIGYTNIRSYEQALKIFQRVRVETMALMGSAWKTEVILR